MRNKGFTLIELLIVIAVLGILAAVILVAINPLEQFNKAKDAGAINRAKQVIGAAERYYVSRAVDPANCAGLETAQELKADTCAALPAVTLTLPGVAGSYTATFTPLSQTYLTKCVVGSPCIVPNEVQ